MVLIRPGLASQLLVGDPAMGHRGVARDELVEPALDVCLVDTASPESKSSRPSASPTDPPVTG